MRAVKKVMILVAGKETGLGKVVTLRAIVFSILLSIYAFSLKTVGSQIGRV